MDDYEELEKHLKEMEPPVSDGIVWLQGDRFDRGAAVVSLHKATGSTIFIVGNDETVGSRRQLGEENVTLGRMREWLEIEEVPSSAISVVPHALNTCDQSVLMMQEAKRRAMKSMTIVVSEYHVVRAFLTFLRARQEASWKGELFVRSVPPASDKAPSGINMSARELKLMEKQKIAKYGNDVSSITEGRDYVASELFDTLKSP